MRERVRHDVALGLALQAVVADGSRRTERLLDVPGLQDAAHALGVMGPEARVAVGLEFQPDGELVGLGPAQPLLQVAHLPGRAQQVLDVVADLVGHHVGPGEVAAGAHAPGKVVEERRVDEYPLVRRAVERPHGRLGEAASGLHGSVEQHELRLPVGAAHLRKPGGPDVLGVGEHHGHELPRLGLGRRLLVRAGVLDRRRRDRFDDPGAAQDQAGIDAQEHADEHDGDQAQAAAHHAAAADPEAAPVLHVGTLPLSPPPHDPVTPEPIPPQSSTLAGAHRIPAPSQTRYCADPTRG